MSVFSLKGSKKSNKGYYDRIYGLMSDKEDSLASAPTQRLYAFASGENTSGHETYFSKIEFSDLIYPSEINTQIEQILEEYSNKLILKKFKLSFSNKILLHGPSGCGKTMTAMALANALNKKVCVINLATIVDSGLGKTANNIYNAIETAKAEEAIIFFDEFDALAKARSDKQDQGEVKRVVSALLQIMDYLGDDTLFIAATNYIEALDKAIVRRFSKIIKFKIPTKKERGIYIHKLFNASQLQASSAIVNTLASDMDDKSYAEIRDVVLNKLKKYVLYKTKRKEDIAKIDKDILSI